MESYLHGWFVQPYRVNNRIGSITNQTHWIRYDTKLKVPLSSRSIQHIDTTCSNSSRSASEQQRVKMQFHLRLRISISLDGMKILDCFMQKNALLSLKNIILFLPIFPIINILLKIKPFFCWRIHELYIWVTKIISKNIKEERSKSRRVLRTDMLALQVFCTETRSYL